MKPEVELILGTALVTAIVALLSVYLTNRGNRQREQENFDRLSIQKSKELKIEKLEELYFLFSKWSTELISKYMITIPQLVGEISVEASLESKSKAAMTEPGTFQKYQMLVQMYFPELKPALNNVFTARNECAEFLHFKEKQSKETISKFVRAQGDFSNAAEQFLAEVAKLASTL